MLLDVFNTDEPADCLLHRLRRWQKQQHSHHCPPTAEHPTIDYSAAIFHLITISRDDEVVVKRYQREKSWDH